MMPDHLRILFTLHSRLPAYRHRVARAFSTTREWLELCQKPYIAFSGGKDSTVILHITRQLAPDTPAIYLDADNCFPEVSDLIDQTPNCTRYPTSEPFLATLKRFGLDGGKDLDRQTMKSTVYEPVRKLIDEYGYDGCIYGIRAEESHGRRKSVQVHKEIFFAKGYGVWQCQPIGWWLYRDIWTYIVSNNVPYAGTYDKMWDMPPDDQRVSYWAGETKRRYGRYAWLKRTYPDLWNKLCQELPEVRSYA